MLIKKKRKNTIFYIVRHGETEWNKKGIIQGQKNSPLTKKGIEQIKQTAKILKNIKFDLVFSSDLGRAYQSAQVIVADRDLVIKTTKLLRESDFGEFNGKSIAYFRQKLQKTLQYRKQLSAEQAFTHKLAPSMESYEETASRVIRFMKETALAYPGKNILSISHGRVLKSLLLKFGLSNHKTEAQNLIANAAHLVIESDGVEFFVKDTCGIKFAKNEV